MKITITQIVLEFDGPQDEEPAPVRKPNPLDTLLTSLTREVKNEQKTWDQHAAGPQTPPGPLGGRQYHKADFFNQRSETT